MFQLSLYQLKIKTKEANNDIITKFFLDGSFQEVNRLFVLAFNDTTQNVAGNAINITTNRVQRLITYGRNCYDQPTNDQIKKYGEI